MSTENRHEVEEEKKYAAPEKMVTVNGVVKTFGIVVTAVSAIISIVWFAASIKGEIITDEQESVSFKHEVEVEQAQQQKDIDKLQDREDKTESVVADLNRKLDVAVTILERIDKKVGAQ